MKENDFDPRKFVRKAEDKLGFSLRSDVILLAYLGFFMTFNLMNISLLAPSGWATYTTSNSGPAEGAMWVESPSIRWADGSYEYYFGSADEISRVTTNPSQSIGSVWVEGDTLHWVDTNGYEQKYTQPQNLGNSGASKGSIWLASDGYIHYVSEYGDEMSTDEAAGPTQ